ncbi:hypothetical protein L1887_59647 [Cichorium endivia]|nr:hypothetical protein L1887_59647 [Cichorium endivia]
MWASAFDGCNDGRVRRHPYAFAGEFHAEKRPSRSWVPPSELRARKRLPALNLMTRCRGSRRWCRQSKPFSSMQANVSVLHQADTRRRISLRTSRSRILCCKSVSAAGWSSAGKRSPVRGKLRSLLSCRSAEVSAHLSGSEGTRSRYPMGHRSIDTPQSPHELPI